MSSSVVSTEEGETEGIADKEKQHVSFGILPSLTKDRPSFGTSRRRPSSSYTATGRGRSNESDVSTSNSKSNDSVSSSTSTGEFLFSERLPLTLLFSGTILEESSNKPVLETTPILTKEVKQCSKDIS